MDRTEPSYEALTKIMDDLKAKQAQNKKDFVQASKERFTKIVNTKVKTTFIGALSEFEKGFGFLWGLKPENGYTDDQLAIKEALLVIGMDEAYFKQIWDVARNGVLNNGNNQMKALQKEADLYEMTWLRHRLTLPVINPGKEGK